MKKILPVLQSAALLGTLTLVLNACSVSPSAAGRGRGPVADQSAGADRTSAHADGRTITRAARVTSSPGADAAAAPARSPTSQPSSAQKTSSTAPSHISLQSDVSGSADQITVDGKLKATPTIVSAQDENGGTVLELSADIAHAQFTPGLNDGLKLALAASRSFVSPDLRGCVLTDDSLLVLGKGSQTVSIGARDASGTTTCADFMVAVQKHGFTVQYIDVPLLSGNGNVKTVFVNLSAP